MVGYSWMDVLWVKIQQDLVISAAEQKTFAQCVYAFKQYCVFLSNICKSLTMLMILMSLKSFEIFPKHSRYGLFSESFALN